jgi:hypothetical protein
MGNVGNGPECSILVGKPEWKRSHARHRHAWKDDIKMDLKVMGLGNVV